MPYKLKGNTIMHKKGGKWSKKQTAKNRKNAKRTIRLLQALKHNPDFKPRG